MKPVLAPFAVLVPFLILVSIFALSELFPAHQSPVVQQRTGAAAKVEDPKVLECMELLYRLGYRDAMQILLKRYTNDEIRDRGSKWMIEELYRIRYQEGK